MIGLTQLRSKVEEEFRKWSSINYFVQSATFKFIYDGATVEGKKKLMVAAMSGDQQYFKKFIQKRKEELEPFEKLSYRKLRSIAKNLRIVEYYRMNKVTLVEEIKNEINRIKADTQQIIDQSEE